MTSTVETETNQQDKPRKNTARQSVMQPHRTWYEDVTPEMTGQTTLGLLKTPRSDTKSCVQLSSVFSSGILHRPPARFPAAGNKLTPALNPDHLTHFRNKTLRKTDRIAVRHSQSNTQSVSFIFSIIASISTTTAMRDSFEASGLLYTSCSFSSRSFSC